MRYYSGYPWIMDRLKRENPGKDEDWIKKKYVSITKSQSLECLIEKYGLEEGKRRYDKRNKNVGFGHTLEGFIKKYGKEEGIRRYLESKEKRSKYKTLDGLIILFGEDEGHRRYNDLLKSLNRSLDSYIERYGYDEGYKKYLERCDKISRSSTLDGFIDRYGEELGGYLYNDHADKSKNTLENFISRHGENEGNRRWNEYLEKLANRKNYSISKISLELFDSIKSRLIKLGYEDSDILYGENEQSFLIDIIGLNKKANVRPDFYLKSRKLAIEFYGDYWHSNPERLSEDDDGESFSELWDWDRLRIRSMYYSEYVDSVQIVWESEYNNDKEGTINKLIKFLTEYGQN